jgi:hypothetical protein
MAQIDPFFNFFLPAWQYPAVQVCKRYLIARDVFSLFGWLVADGWCWFVLREEYRWLVAAGCWWLVRSERKVLLAGG